MSRVFIQGVVNLTEPVEATDPGYDKPSWGGPADPGYDRPSWGGGRPDNSLPPEGGHIWGALIRWLLRPHADNDPSKPPGRPVRPWGPGIDNGLPPNGGRPPHPWRPGHWEPIDPGFGKPPLWGWIPGIDNGLPDTPTTKPIEPDVPGTKPTPPGQGGAWVPTDPDYGKPVRPCPPVGGRPHPPIWAWIPDRPEVDPPEGGEGQATVTLYPTTGTVLAAGASVSVNVTLTTPGTWQVEPASVPDWVTYTPQGPQTADVNVVMTAAKNTTGKPKQALIKVNGATFTLNQGAV
jgi:hypothetical protein